ncbi:MAG: hypothetical protein ACT4PV_03815 [Planctomycetaceae bacterium]
MNLLVNAIIPVVNFVLALAGQSQQTDVATSMTAGFGRGAAVRGSPSHAPAALRLLQLFDQVAPRDRVDAMTGAQVRALLEARDRNAWLVEEGIGDLPCKGEDGAKARVALEELER